MGYCESATQYRVYIPSKPGRDKTIVSANVQFLEESFWEWGEPSHQTISGEILPLDDDLTLTPETNTDTGTESELEMDTSDTQRITHQFQVSPTRNTSIGGARETSIEAGEEPERDGNIFAPTDSLSAADESENVDVTNPPGPSKLRMSLIPQKLPWNLTFGGVHAYEIQSSLGLIGSQGLMLCM